MSEGRFSHVATQILLKQMGEKQSKLTATLLELFADIS